MDRILNRMREAVFIGRESVRSFRVNGNFTTAAALAYYGFFGIIPLLLLTVIVLGNYITSSSAALKEIDALAARIFPQFSKDIIYEIRTVARHGNKLELAGLLGAFWAVMPLTGAIREAFQKIHRTGKRMPYMREKLFDAGAVFIILVLFVIMALSGAGYTVLSKQLLYKIPAAYRMAYFVYPLLLTLLFLGILYLLFSPKLEAPRLWTGLTAAAAVWMGLREFFSYFLAINPSYGLAYGSLKAVFVMVVWVYFSFCVILMGAEIMATMGRKDALLLKGLFYAAPRAGGGRERMLGPFITEAAPGETVFNQGERGQFMYHILSGSVAVHHEGRLIKTFTKGDFFGEMSLLLGMQRTATATAGEDGARIVEISRENFTSITAEDPNITLLLLKQMALRLKRAGDHI